MSYTPTNWQTGDTVTAERLNKMEQGIAAAADPFIVNLTPTAQDLSGTMDKTPAEIYEAFQAGKKIKGIVAGMGSTIDFTAFVESNGAVNCQASFVYSINGTPVLMNIITNRASSIYATQIFPLTPMS